MSSARPLTISTLIFLLLISSSGCARHTPPGAVNSDPGILQVSTSALQWQRERGPHFKNPEEARDYAAKLELGGYSDWRLPTREEMLDFYYAFDFGSARASELNIHIEGYYWVMDVDGVIFAGSWADGEICEISRSYRPSTRGGFVRAVRQ